MVLRMTTVGADSGLTTKLDVNSRVVLPRAARDAAGIEPGATLAVLVENDGVIRLMTRRAVTLELQRLFKPLKDSGYTTDDFNRERREEAEAESDEPHR